MSDQTVSEALRSDAQLVVIEAPAGCGKTYQAAQYAQWLITEKKQRENILILTHTHAACGVFRSRTSNVAKHVTISTLHGLLCEIAEIYHQSLQLPRDVAAWARTQKKNGFDLLAQKVIPLLKASPNIGNALIRRYPTIICDEHQDTSAEQHELILQLHKLGAKLRIFGDPMQSIYGADAATAKRWSDLVSLANRYVELTYPHRWANSSLALGQWIHAARTQLKGRHPIDLTNGLPDAVKIIHITNLAQQRHGGFQLSKDDRKPLDRVFNEKANMLILCTQNQTVRSLRSFWWRSVPIWEGQVRDGLWQFVNTVKQHVGHAENITTAVIEFMQHVSIGFTRSNFGNRLMQEVQQKCQKKTNGKPLKLQQIAQLILNAPNHIGATQALSLIRQLSQSDEDFKTIKFDLHREFWEAIRIGGFENADDGLAKIAQLNAIQGPVMPQKCLSTVHKAKGLECDNAIILPCDAAHFNKSDKHRCLLYVALSRASSRLTLVISKDQTTPWFKLQ